MLDQEPLGEAVEGADGGAVEIVESAGAAVDHDRVARAPRPFEFGLDPAPDAVAQLAGRLLGERDRGDGIDAGGDGGDEVDDEPQQLQGLPRTGPRIIDTCHAPGCCTPAGYVA